MMTYMTYLYQKKKVYGVWICILFFAHQENATVFFLAKKCYCLKDISNYQLTKKMEN